MNNIKLRNYLDRLLYLLIEERKFDLILPIARRGVELIQLSSYANKLLNDRRIVFYDSVFNDLEFLRDKRIVIFDESVDTGRTLLRCRDSLYKILSKNNRKPDIKTAALLIKGKKYIKAPDIFLPELECNEEKFYNLSKMLINEILSEGKPLDSDHILIPIHFKNPSEFYDIGKYIASFNELPHSKCFGNVETFTIDYQNNGFQIPEMADISLLFDSGGPKKIRFYKNEDIIMVPVLYPVMHVKNLEENIKECKLKCTKSGIKLCEYVGDINQEIERIPVRNRICYNCVIMNLNLELISYFKRFLKQYISFEIGRVEEKNFLPFYPSNAKDLVNDINIRLSSLDNQLFSSFKPASKVLNPILSSNLSIINGLEPYLVNSGIIQKQVSLNGKRFNHHVYSQNIDKKKILGLTYQQILNTAINVISFEKASIGMDVALDIGCLTPRTAYEGMLFNNPETFIGICRLYSITGEVNKSLSEFSKHVMKWG